MHLALDSTAAKREPYESALKMAREKVKALGVWFSIDPDITIFQDYNDKLEKIKTTLRLLQFQTGGLLGKVLILKALLRRN